MRVDERDHDAGNPRAHQLDRCVVPAQADRCAGVLEEVGEIRNIMQQNSMCGGIFFKCQLKKAVLCLTGGRAAGDDKTEIVTEELLRFDGINNDAWVNCAAATAHHDCMLAVLLG